MRRGEIPSQTAGKLVLNVACSFHYVDSNLVRKQEDYTHSEDTP